MQSDLHESPAWVPSGIAGLFERPGVYFLTFNLDGHIVDGNSSWRARFGEAADGADPVALLDVVSPDYRSDVIDIFERLRAGVTVTGVELRIVAPDGKHFLASGMISPVLEDGMLASAFCVLREQAPPDFTYRGGHAKTVDPHLLEALVEFAPNGMMITNEHQEVIAWNQNFLELWGLDPSVVSAGHTRAAAARIVEDREAFDAVLEDLTNDREKTGHGSMRLTDGRVIDWYSTSAWDRDGTFIGRAWYYTDATSEAQTAEELRRSENLYRQLAANFPDGGVFIFDSDLTFVIADGEMLSNAGLTREAVEGRKLQDVLPERIYRQLLPAMLAALSGERWRQDVRFYRRTFSVTATPLDSGASNSSCYGMMIAQDVTEQQRLQHQLGSAERRLRALVEQIPAVTYVQQVKASGNETIYISPQVERIFGYAPDALLDGSVEWDATIHPDDRQAVVHATEAANVGLTSFTMEYRAIKRGGGECWVRDSASIITDERGRAQFWQGILSDITEERRLEEALRESESLFRSAFDDAPTGIVLVGLDGTTKRVNKAFCDMLGYDEAELNRPWMIGHFTHPDDVESDLQNFKRLMSREVDRYSTSKRFVRRDGELLWAHTNVSIVEREDGEPDYIVVQVQDITEQHRLEDELRRSETIFRSAFDHAAIGMARVAPDGTFLDANASLCRMFGYSRDELLVLDFLRITHPDDLQEDLDLVGKMLDGEIASYNLSKRYIHRDGSIVWGDLSVSLVRGDDGEPLFFISQIQDITQKKDLESQLAYLAHHDHLTGLLNRHGFSQALDALDSVAWDAQVGVLMLDMDGFKGINDAYGHMIGDRVLSEVASRLRSCVRDNDVVARLGGDEFVVVLARPIDSAFAETVGARIQAAVEAPIQLSPGGPEMHVGVSIGVVVGKRADLESELIRTADDAMFAEKRQRRCG